MTCRIALFGGTFDPVHIGHLRLLLEVQAHFQFDEVRVLPCRPINKNPLCSENQRLKMLDIALLDLKRPEIIIDHQELQRTGSTRTVESLEAIRNKLGNQVSITLMMGMDAHLTFEQWHQPNKIRSMAHLLVVNRPDHEPPSHLQTESASELNKFSDKPSGEQLFWYTTPLRISSSLIRTKLQKGESVKYLLPAPVLEYIEANDLYRHQNQSTS